MYKGLNGKTYANIKCNRCRWVGIEEEQAKVPDKKDHFLTHYVCPRCNCRTFTLVNEIKGNNNANT